MGTSQTKIIPLTELGLKFTQNFFQSKLTRVKQQPSSIRWSNKEHIDHSTLGVVNTVESMG